MHKETVSAFGIQFLDLPGVFSAYDELNTIVMNAVEALQLYAEDEALSATSSYAEIVAREDVRTELAEGANRVSSPF